MAAPTQLWAIIWSRPLMKPTPKRHLGRAVSFARCQETELHNRIAAGWSAFHQHKGELCSKFYRLADRARLFDSVITPTVLYGCACWGITKQMEKKLITVRRKMLRFVFQLHRKQSEELEDWVQYVQSSAHRVDALSESLQMSSWVEAYRIRKWRFAGELARQEDSRWSQQAAEWKPNGGFGRRRGAPRTRWEDQLVRFAGGDWMSIAQDEDTWGASEEVFAGWNF